MTKNEVIFNIVIPLISSLIGGGLTVLGVLISIHHEKSKRKEEIKNANKPLIYLIDPMQDYNHKDAIQFFFINDDIESEGFIQIILKNTDNAIMVMDNIKVDNDYYYPHNGNVVEKNTILYINVSVNKSIKDAAKANIILSIKDIMGNIYKYKLGYRSSESRHIDLIKEI